jgi:hypothetical protein
VGNIPGSIRYFKEIIMKKQTNPLTKQTGPVKSAELQAGLKLQTGLLVGGGNLKGKWP